MGELLVITGTCEHCGKELKKKVRYRPEYGIVRLDNSGECFDEFDLCDECFATFMERIHELGEYLKTE